MSDICVLGGAGRIGLPLSIAFANSGLSVDILDINQTALDTIGKGQMPFMEDGVQERLKEALKGNLGLYSEPEKCIPNCKFLLVVAGTPVDEFLNPKWDNLLKIFQKIKPYLKDQIIILRSTVFPGTTERIAAELGTNRIAFCPERIVEGQFFFEIGRFPQIVSVLDSTILPQVSELFLRLAPSVETLSVKEAELAKLFCNAYRYIQFAAVNQFYMIAENLGADFRSIRKAIMKDYPRMSGFPTPGFAAGPCLLKDTMQLASAANSNFLLGHAAMLTNEGLPQFIVKNHGIEMKGKTVAILGMAFKNDTDDIRDSLSYKLGKLLRFHGATVIYSDEYVRDPSFTDRELAIERADTIIIATPHSAYRSLKIPENKIVIDLFGITEKSKPSIGLDNHSISDSREYFHPDIAAEAYGAV